MRGTRVPADVVFIDEEYGRTPEQTNASFPTLNIQTIRALLAFAHSHEPQLRVKVLLDENIPHDVRPHLSHHDTYTVAYLGWGGLKSGRLLEAAEDGAFEVLVAGDLSMSYQQNLTRRRISIVSLSAIGWPIIEPHIARIVSAVDVSRAGGFVRVDCGAFSRKK